MISNLDYYKVFYYVAKCGSVSVAAGELSISQPAVSQAVKQLEQTLGVKLFTRAARGVKLTAEGEALFPYVSEGYQSIEQGVQRIRSMQDLELGEIHIGASDMTLQFYLLPFLERFHEEYPGIKVVVTNAPTPETMNILKEGKIDFGVVSTPMEAASGFEVHTVREIEDIFVAGRRFIGYKNKTLDLQELEKMPLILLEKETSTRKYMDEFLAGNGVVINPEFELATSDMIVQFAKRNLGVGCVVRDFAKEKLDSGELFELRFNTMIPKRRFAIVTKSGATLSSAASRLLKSMNEAD